MINLSFVGDLWILDEYLNATLVECDGENEMFFLVVAIYI